MAEKRDRVGFGSSYRKGSLRDIGSEHEIGAVLGGQVWMVKPDKKAAIKNPCLWMTAGVVKNKNCTNFFDCTTCKYDQGMRRAVEQGKQTSWQNAMRLRPDLERVCRHTLTGRIANRACGYDYECSKCDFDQYFEDIWTPRAKSIPSDVQQVKGFAVPMDYYFHNGHTWARIESGGFIRIGMDDFSMKLLGKADAMDMPLMGKEVDMGKAGWGMRRRNNEAAVLSPVGGVIVEVNPTVREKPELANREPYSDGWMFVVRTPDVKASMKQLMANSDSINWISDEVNTLEGMIEEVAGPLAADGGHLQEDIYGNLPDLGWNNLTKTFLKTG